MSKKQLEQILNILEIPCNEGIQNMEIGGTLPRLVYFEYVWEDITASGESYDTKVSYQISFFSLSPRDPKLILLKKLLAKQKLFPIIQHEYIPTKREFHSYFSIEVLENVSESI